MRLYIDLNCFNRLFDDQRQRRIRTETEAVFATLSRVIEGKDSLIWSWVMSFENAKHPKPDRREEIALWENRAAVVVALDAGVEKRAHELKDQGFSSLDATHLASAESAGADVFLTCDDAIVKRARRTKLGLRVLNPVAYWHETVSRG
jgi:predicted nucleic acid-binding protein